MKSLNFNKNWTFAFDRDLDGYNHYGLHGAHKSQGAPECKYHFTNWKKIDLPHDWAITLPKDLRCNTYSGARAQSHYNRYTTDHNAMVDAVYSVGWYRKEFFFEDSWKGKRLFLEFEGIYRHADFWINGIYMENHVGGYTGHIFEITDLLMEGESNSLAVRVDTEQAEGWWYEGAGIYRNVNLLIGEPVYWKPLESLVRPEATGALYASGVLVNDTDSAITTPVVWTVLDKDGCIVASQQNSVTIPAYSQASVCADLTVENPLLWDLDAPHLYTLKMEAMDIYEEVFGFRQLAFSGQEGFSLNGRSVKICGACVHQDHGGVGVALSDNLIRYRIRKLKEMGVNAYRSSHHAPSPALLRICDEEGMLVMSETRLFNTSAMAMEQLEDLVRRGRNHPCVFMWCLGNEEWIQHMEFAGNIARKMRRLVNELDGTRPCTYAGNDNGAIDGIFPAVDVKGVNYIHNVAIDKYHQEHPEDWIIGTEECSCVTSRAALATNYAGQELVSSGMVTMAWGATPKGWVKHMMERPWYMGSFMWTGFDYHGEPCPYVHSAFNSYFGAIDLSGIEKPIFYYYQAWFKDAPMLKLTPHWNYRAGETVTVNVFTNCEKITLKLNGKVIAQQDVAPYDAPEFTLVFEPGVLEAEGVRSGEIYRDRLETANAPVRLRQDLILSCECEEDIGIIELSAEDEAGNLCVECNKEVALSFVGGDIIGVCNGDPQDPYYEQKPQENAYYAIRAFETEYGLYAIPPKQDNVYSNSPYRTEGKQVIYHEPKQDGFEDDYRQIAIRQSIRYMYEAKEYTFITQVNLDRDFTYLEFERLYGNAKVYLDGIEIGTNATSFSKNNRPFRFDCKATAGYHEVKVVTTLDDGTHGGMSGYVRFGKEINRNRWSTYLHGGKTRVFVKYTGEYKLDADFIE